MPCGIFGVKPGGSATVAAAGLVKILFIQRFIFTVGPSY
jgi:hypothetical protein